MNAFGVRGGDYDFDASDPKEVAQHLKILKSEQDSLVSVCKMRRSRACIRRTLHSFSPV
jgi:hypothetical protein